MGIQRTAPGHRAGCRRGCRRWGGRGCRCRGAGCCRGGGRGRYWRGRADGAGGVGHEQVANPRLLSQIHHTADAGHGRVAVCLNHYPGFGVIAGLQFQSAAELIVGEWLLGRSMVKVAGPVGAGVAGAAAAGLGVAGVRGAAAGRSTGGCTAGRMSCGGYSGAGR